VKSHALAVARMKMMVDLPVLHMMHVCCWGDHVDVMLLVMCMYMLLAHGGYGWMCCGGQAWLPIQTLVRGVRLRNAASECVLRRCGRCTPTCSACPSVRAAAPL
jgi:hypothetical protein